MIVSEGVFSGTGFSREEANRHAARLGVIILAPSRRKPVPLRKSGAPAGLASDIIVSERVFSGTGFSREWRCSASQLDRTPSEYRFAHPLQHHVILRRVHAAAEDVAVMPLQRITA